MADYTDTKVSQLVINNLTQEKFEELKAAGQLQEDQIYCTPDSGNGFDLFDSKWADHILNDPSWLRADNFSWHSGDVYVAAYNHLAEECNGKEGVSETVNGIEIWYVLAEDGHKICPATEESNVQALFESTGVAWYYIIDEANKRFKLPRTKYAFTGLRDSVGGYIEAGVPNLSATVYGEQGNATKGFGIFRRADGNFVELINGIYPYAPQEGTSGWAGNSANKGFGGVKFDASKASPVYGNSDTVQPRATQMYLYFYVGDWIKDKELVDVGTIAEGLNNKADLAIFDAIYPVGSVYIGTQATCPMAIAIPNSTWELLEAGRALWTGNGSNGNTKIAAGIPNITGDFFLTGSSGSEGTFSGAFYKKSTQEGFQHGTSGAKTNPVVGIDASRSSSVYGNSTTVQPPAYVVNVWRRTA